MTANQQKIVLLAGEPSGDFLGAQLMAAFLKRQKGHSKQPSSHVKFYGIGGPLMQAQGLHTFFSTDDLGFMGFLLSPKALWQFRKRIKETVARILALKPDVVVTIDFPGFNFRVAKALKAHGIPLVHYVAPTVWAWRPKRAQKMAKRYDHLLCLFAFEPPYFEKHGLATTFVGHPLVELPWGGDTQKWRQSHHIPLAAPLLAVLPGSRVSEIKRHLPIFAQTIPLLQKHFPKMRVVLPTVPHLKEAVAEATQEWAVPVHIIIDVDQKTIALEAADIALAASGTVTLELALAKTPMVVAYKTARLNAWLAKKLLQIKHVALVNILANKTVVPEWLQENCVPEKLAGALEMLLKDQQQRQQQLEAFEKILPQITPPTQTPSECAATAVQQCVAVK